MLSRKKRVQLEAKIQAWKNEKDLIDEIYKMSAERRDLRKKYNSHKMPSTSKLLIAFLFISCTLIELFTGYVTLKSFELAEMTMMTPDLSPLMTLIGSVVSETVGFAIYALKSAKENTKGGIVYDTAMAQYDSVEGGNNYD